MKDLEYIKHFPKGEKYISLFVRSEDEEVSKKASDELERLRKMAAKNAKAAIRHKETADGFVKNDNEEEEEENSEELKAKIEKVRSEHSKKKEEKVVDEKEEEEDVDNGDDFFLPDKDEGIV